MPIRALVILCALSLSGAFAQEAPTLSDAMPIDPRHYKTSRVHRHPVSPTIEEQGLEIPETETSIGANSSVSTAVNERWHTKALTYKTLGADVNNFYHLVGLPKSCICQFTSGTPAYSEHGHDFFYATGDRKIFMEVEYSANGQNIRRFRFIKKLSDTVLTDRFGGWQSENTRQHITDFTDGMSILLIDEKRDLFEMPFACQPFDSKTWKIDELCRRWCLFEIAHSYPIVGMRHEKLISILGVADYRPQAPSDTPTKFDYVDKYVLIRGDGSYTSILKIAYKDEKAVAFCVGAP